MNVHQLAVQQPKKMLQNLLRWLDEAAAFAESKKFEPDRWLEMRLAPDQFSLLRQIQSACDAAKFVAARLSASEAPKHADDEKTFDEIRARIRAVVDYLDTVEASALEGAEERKITLSFLPEGKWVRGEDYLIEFGLPNFYFHITHAYAILRHNGVALGKMTYIARIELQDS